MACKRWIAISKRIISFFVLLVLCTCIIFVCLNRPKVVKAEPITGAIVITGAILAFLAACGVELTSSDMDTTTLQQCVEDMTSDYTYDNHTGATSWYADAGTVANIISGGNAGDKTVIIGSAFSQWLQGLPDHLEQKYGLNSSSSSSIVNNGTGFVDESGNLMPYTKHIGNSSLYYGTVADGLFPIPLTPNSSRSWTFSNGNTITLTLNENLRCYLYVNDRQIGYAGKSTGQNVFICANNDLSRLRVYWLYWTNDFNGLYPGNYIEDIPLSALSGVSSTTIGVSGHLVDGYQDLQDAMDEALGRIETNVDGVIGLNVGAMEGTITQEDVWERIYADALDNSLSSELTGDYADEDEAKEELEQNEMPTTGELTGNIVVIDGLEDFFPFCIPFDLYEIISLLNVSPEAPKFEWTMNFAGIFDDYEIEIDLSDWETVARVFRVMVVIGFAVFLILKTRDLIRG